MTNGTFARSGIGGTDLSVLADRWWLFALRGVAAILFAVLTFAAPRITLLMLVTYFGAYALVDGVFELVMAVRKGRAGERWGWLLFEGLVSIAAGVVAFLWPGITALWLLFLIAAWSIIRGVAEIAAAVRLRKHIRGEWMLGLAGLFSIALGVLLFVSPGTGALAMVFYIGAYALVAGALMIGLAFRLRSFKRRGPRQVPRGGVPTPA